MTRSQARATMRVAWGLRLPRARASAYRRPAQGEANREWWAKAVRDLRNADRQDVVYGAALVVMPRSAKRACMPMRKVS
jgi:hypothetical protein